jgi:hypothetical protein
MSTSVRLSTIDLCEPEKSPRVMTTGDTMRHSTTPPAMTLRTYHAETARDGIMRQRDQRAKTAATAAPLFAHRMILALPLSHL